MPALTRSAFALVLLAGTAAAQPPTAPVEGIGERAEPYRVLRNARIVTAPGQTLERGRIVIRGDRIVAVDQGDAVPAGADTRDLGVKFQ